MLRVTLLLAVLGVAHCVVWGHHHGGPEDFNFSGDDDHGHGHGRHQGWGHHGCGGGGQGCSRRQDQPQTWHSEYDRRFDRLSAYIMRADRFAKEFCDSFTPNDVQELHGNSFYQLTYTMPQVDSQNITVKIKHRVLYMYARQSDSATSPTFVDVRVLPDTLKMSDAAWKYEQNQLSIVIPYDPVLRTKIMKTCVDVNADVKDVPKSALIYKFGDDDQTIQ